MKNSSARKMARLPCRLRGSACLVQMSILLLLVTGPQLYAQSVARENLLFIEDSIRAAAGAAGAVGARHPASVASILLAGKAMMVWEILPAVPVEKAGVQDVAAPVDPDLLPDVEDRAPVRSADANYNEFLSYNYLLVRAHKTPSRALARGARHDLTFAHLWEEPEKYRGQIVHLEGRLIRLRKFASARIAAKEGVPVLYEGWVYDEKYYYNPFCVIVSELPQSIQVGEKLDYQVAFDGYFFKRYRYQAGDHTRDAPLLIGRTLTALAASSGASESPGPMLLNAFLAVLGVTAILGIGLSLWFRRGDRNVRSYLDANRGAGFVDPTESDERAP